MNHKLVYDCYKIMTKKAAQLAAAFLLLDGDNETENNDSNARSATSFFTGETTTKN